MKKLFKDIEKYTVWQLEQNKKAMLQNIEIYESICPNARENNEEPIRVFEKFIEEIDAELERRVA